MESQAPSWLATIPATVELKPHVAYLRDLLIEQLAKAYRGPLPRWRPIINPAAATPTIGRKRRKHRNRRRHASVTRARSAQE
jgi:hypothetical protein